MHIGTMRNSMSTCAQYGIVGVPITIFFQYWSHIFPNLKKNTIISKEGGGIFHFCYFMGRTLKKQKKQSASL
jgi:hypothetical protein